MTTTVVHLKRDDWDIRIDRKGPYGNPFVIGVDGDRDEVIAKHDTWVRTSMCDRALWVRQHLHELRGKRLGCWCAPLGCHGHTLAAMADADFVTINPGGTCFTCGRTIGRAGRTNSELVVAAADGDVLTAFGSADYSVPQPWPTTYFCGACHPAKVI